MRRGSGAARRHVDLARISLGIGNELGNRFGRNRRVHRHYVWRAHDAGNGRDVTNEIEIQLVKERRIGRVRRYGRKKRIAVARGSQSRFGADVPAIACSVLNNKGLPESIRQPLPHQARNNICRTARHVGNYNAHWPQWIGLRPCDARGGGQRGSARRQMQELAAVMFHGCPPCVVARCAFGCSICKARRCCLCATRSASRRARRCAWCLPAAGSRPARA